MENSMHGKYLKSIRSFVKVAIVEGTLQNYRQEITPNAVRPNEPCNAPKPDNHVGTNCHCSKLVS
ncbi:hypothetical protein BU23DRAFT_33563 [Bimuria novae-zelandiae CBS 107.79]|uniref:Uncharacterized protein n=1 Tax=Bimuria novae-zelandiae CBS 107.79 TaxID=1447943 RepID=A0A6A5UKE2_9PLEO|nr:hypothetical protein BU23DRAFT_33563 [Bimuria novae-zelandiae CBS 107.79]